MPTASDSLAPVWRKPLALVMLLLGGVLLVVAFRVLVADVAAVQAQMFIDDWIEKRKAPQSRAWHVADAAAERAIRWYPSENGLYLTRRAQIMEWQQLNAPRGAQEARSAREAAISLYRQAIETRPLWPYTHNELAYAKLRNLQFDAEFHQALADSARLGPGRMPAHAMRVEIGLIAWPQMDATERQGIWQSLETVLEYEPRRAQSLRRLAQRAQLDVELCRQLDPELLQRRRWCQG
ncbi:hypothetical protein [Marinobacterium sediminicola]|uniref:MxaK protein n=1 Tax=Marinobacterium sediminicola TaxID=518898 RepID=A0ABY1S0L2_9GAMM|nr:hypothetical protein [Marinobacterium sediminicola]ULG68370.1 hypothetical protein LN244_11765 [Marinobacterium sediminicola]SMR74751.1 hypothetical protein SAMN04487964_10848 [Marinobacterium sediminicola]